jgi:signal recognition particle GTPase
MNNLANAYLMQKDPRGLATAQAALALTKVLFMGTAAQALALARRWGVDVVVVDKAGRLQASGGWA